jgi:hypothetical protein
MSRARVVLAASVPLLGAMLLAVLHAAGVEAMDGLGIAESLLSPGGASAPWMVVLALCFVGVRLAAILAVPGLVLVAAYAGLTATAPRGGTGRPARPGPDHHS